MAETMLAVRTHGPRDYRVEEVPVPEPGPGELLIEVGAVGICASDMKCWLGGPLFWGEDGKGGYVEGPVHRRARVRRPGRRPRRRARRSGTASRSAIGSSPSRSSPAASAASAERTSTGCASRHWIFGFKQHTQRRDGQVQPLPGQARSSTRCPNRSPTARPPTSSRWPAPGTRSTAARSRPGDTVVICGVGNIGLCMLQIARLSNPAQLIALDAKAVPA